MQCVIVVLSAEQTLDTLAILQGNDRILVDDANPSGFVLYKLFVWCPPDGSRKLTCGQPRHGIELVRCLLIDIAQRACRLLLPVLRPQRIREMAVELMDIGQPDDLVIQPFRIIAMTKRGKEVVAHSKSVLLAKRPGIV